MKFRIQHFHKISSTNTKAKKEAQKGAAEGLVIVADYQTQGRGRFHRRWISPPEENLLFSLLLRPPMTPREAPLLTQIACRSVASLLKNLFDLNPSFKRPNDIVIKGKKICGVLTEASSLTKDHLDWVIIGIGLNVNSRSEDLASGATSIYELTKKRFSPKKILKELLDQVKRDLEKASLNQVK